MYFVLYFFPFITVIFIIVTMTNLLQSSCIMLNKILSSIIRFNTSSCGVVFVIYVLQFYISILEGIFHVKW